MLLRRQYIELGKRKRRKHVFQTRMRLRIVFKLLIRHKGQTFPLSLGNPPLRFLINDRFCAFIAATVHLHGWHWNIPQLSSRSKEHLTFELRFLLEMKKMWVGLDNLVLQEYN